MVQEGLIPSKRFDVWSRLYDRYSLEPNPLLKSQASVGLTIIPVTQADELLKQPRSFTETTEASATLNANLALATVPQGRRWGLLTFNVARLTGDNTFSRIQLFDASQGVTVILTEFSASTSENLRLEVPYRLDEGDLVTVLMDGAGSSASNIRLVMWLEDEAAF